jgi:hypothetical protein
MVRAIVIAFLCVVVFATSAAADFGAGIIAGEPTGLSAKLQMSRASALDFAVAWSFGSGEDALLVLADYVLHNYSLLKVDQGTMAIYFGVGGRIKFSEDEEVGVRVPFGLDYMFQGTPVDVFGEIVPVLELVDDTELNWNGAVGVRYFFGGTSYR